MTEELLARWREAQDKLKQAKEALDSFQQFVVKFQEEQAKIAEKLQFPSARMYGIKRNLEFSLVWSCRIIRRVF